jgi:hypothetical protein
MLPPTLLPAGVSPQRSEKSSSTPPKDVPSPNDKYLQAAQAIEKAAQSGDSKKLDELIDWDEIYDKATADLNVSAQVRSRFFQGMKEESQKTGGVSRLVTGAVALGGSYKLVRVHKIDNQTRALFRLVLPNAGGINYHDLVLNHSRSGQIRAEDVFIFLTGEFLSTTFRRGLLSAAAQFSSTRLAGLKPSDAAYVKHLPQILEMIEHSKKHEPRKALDVYNELPPELKSDKNLLLLRLGPAQALGGQEYANAMDDFRSFHPSDTCIDFLSIDHHVLKKEFDAAIACVQRVDKSLGGDAYLQVILANILVAKEDLPAAAAAARQAIKVEPGLLVAYWAAVTVALRQKKFDETLSLLKSIKRNFNLQFADLTAVPDYAEFVKSSYYQDWLKERGAK